MGLLYYDREKDGTAYFHLHGGLWSCPMNADGTPDYHEDTLIAVDDFADPLTIAEVIEIETALEEIETSAKNI